MSAYRASGEAYAYDGFDNPFVNDDYADNELVSGERICAPFGNARDSAKLRVCTSLSIAIVGGWALMNSGTIFHHLEATARTATEIATPQPESPDIAPTLAAQTSEPARPLPELKSTEVTVAPGTPPQPDSTTADSNTPSDTATAPTEKPESGDAPTAPSKVASATQPDAYKGDPHRSRAAAVGLNPDLSDTLLQRLTPADYHNAAVAIRTALKKTPDTGSFVWPKKRSAKLARFEVHFVAGAAADCRRYVVTITKDHWATTAQPMEKCGIKSPDHKIPGRVS